MKTWKIDAGNSTDGTVGFVLYGIKAATAEDALRIVRETFILPESLQEKTEDDSGHRGLLCVYFNAEKLTLDDIEEDDDFDGSEDDSEERATWQ